MTGLVPTCDCTAQDIANRLDVLLQACGFPAGSVSNPSFADDCVYVDARGAGTTWRLKVDASFRLAGHLPVVSLVTPALLLAHVSYDKTICIDDGQGLSIDASRPADVLAYVLRDAVLVLENAIVDSAQGYLALFDEFEGYCEGIPNGILARASVEADTNSRLIYGHVENLGKGRQVCWYFSEHEGAQPAEFRTSKLANFSGLYVALGGNVQPPAPSSPLDATFVESVVAAFGPTERHLWDGLMRKHRSSNKRLVCMLVSQPRPSGGRSLIGLTFHLRKGKLDPNGQVRHLMVRRHTAGYMRERGGASNDLAEKHVAVLGCGSVGSEIADTLASCGVGRLTLVDYDTMDIENVFRHSLGKDAVGQDKVKALKAQLTSKYPGLEVIAAPFLASSWLATDYAQQVDIVVLAIGRPATEQALTRQIRSRGLQINIVVTWLEALGLGGHVVTLSASGEGCLDCIYRDGEGQASLYPAVSFLAPGQKVSRSLSGCLGTFIPYSALHSRKTALLATEAVLNALAGPVESRYMYWVGSDFQANAQGIETSAWFKRADTLDPEKASRVLFGAPCPTCRQVDPS